MPKVGVKTLLVLGAVLVISAPAAWADTVSANTFHLNCIGSTACASVVFSGGALLATDNVLPTFAIRRSPANDSGLSAPELTVAVFVPSSNPTLSYSLDEGTGYTPNSSAAFSLFSATPWTSGKLIDDPSSYLGLTQVMGGGPASPISAFDFFGTGSFDVYLAVMGVISFVGCDNTTPCGSFSFSGISGLPVGSVIYAFVKDTTGANAGLVTDTTAPSSSIVVVPEPGTLALFGTGLLAIAAALRRRLLS